MPVGAVQSIETLRQEADDVICLCALENFVAVGVWYRAFEQVEDEDVLRLLGATGAAT